MAEVGSLSVVIVNWNGGPVLGECLAALFADRPAKGPLEVFLVDNASTDGSQSRAIAAYPQVVLIQNSRNRGFASAVNQALGRAQGDVTLLLNPDVVLTPTAVSRLTGFMAEHPEAAIVGPRLLNADGTVQGSARRDPSPWTGVFGRTALLTRLFPNNRVSRRELPGLGHRSDGPLEVDWVSGACLLARRAAYERVGLMDDGFFLFWEDADWCLRLRSAGWKVYYLPTAEATHRVGVSRGQRVVRSAIDFHVSAYRFYRKHHLPSAFHPMMLVLVSGLALHLGIRLVQALAAGVRR